MNESLSPNLDDLLTKALALPPSAREAYLKNNCNENEDLFEKALNLLEGMDDVIPTSFLEDAPFVPNMAELFEKTLEPEQTIKPGALIGTHRIVTQLGRGGMGEVYLARRVDGRIERNVAIKVMRGERITDEVRRRFQYEQQILAKLQHPNIATLFDVSVTEDGAPYLAMEYIQGQPIDVYCNTRELSVEERLKLFKTVCEAVQHAQSNLVVHRDLKPSNILVTEEGIAKLLDFGIAKLLGRDQEPVKRRANNGYDAAALRKLDPQITLTEHVAPFTMAYAAPEQIDAEPVTTATDVYALGVILYELLTGKRPFNFESSDSLQERLDQIRSTRPNAPSTIVTKSFEGEEGAAALNRSRQRGGVNPSRLKRTLSGDLDAIVLKALQKDPADRYTTGGELARDIQRFLDGQPIRARQYTTSYRFKKFIRRHQKTAIAAAIGFLVLVAGTVSTVRQSQLTKAETRAKEATIQVISNILSKVDPDRREGYSFTAKELISAGLTELQHLEMQPLVHAEIMNEFGKISLNAGLVDLADSLHHAALGIQEQVLPPLHPDLALTHTRLAEVYERRGNFEEAKEHFFEAIAIEPDNHIARNNLAMFYYEQGRYKEAAEQFKLAYELDPSKIMYLRNSGGIYFSIGEWAKAKETLLEAISLEPNATAYSNLATIYYYIDHDFVEAARLYNIAVEINKNDYKLWGNLASALFAADPNSVAAKDATQEAIDLAEEHLRKVDPDDLNVHASLAGFYGRLGNTSKALQHINVCLLDPALNKKLIYSIGYAYEIIGERDDALEYINKAFAMGYDQIYILNEPALKSLRESREFNELMN